MCGTAVPAPATGPNPHPTGANPDANRPNPHATGQSPVWPGNPGIAAPTGAEVPTERPQFVEPTRAPEYVPQALPTEYVIGHLPVEWVQEGAGLFGRTKYTQVNLVVTTSRILCLRETDETNSTWLAEQERLDELSRRSGVPLRTLMDSYNWQDPIWAVFYATGPEDLLAEDRHNWALPLSAIVAVAVTLDEELDQLDLRLGTGEVVRFRLFNQVGVVAARLLAQVLDPRLVQLFGPPPQ